MRWVPLEYDVAGRVALVIGGEAMLAGKVQRLLEAGARVIVYDAGAVIADELAGCERQHGLPDEAALAESCLVLIAPSVEHAVAERIHAWARAHGRLAGAVDRPALSTFATPAATTVAGIGLRFFTFGKSPGLAKRLREELERALTDPRMERFVAELARLRASVPAGERAERMKQALAGFAVRVELRFPDWLEKKQ